MQEYVTYMCTVCVVFERFEDEFGHFEITRIFHIRVSRRKVLEELEGHIPSLEESAEVARLPAVLPHPIGVTRAVVIVGVPIAPPPALALVGLEVGRLGTRHRLPASDTEAKNLGIARRIAGNVPKRA